MSGAGSAAATLCRAATAGMHCEQRVFVQIDVMIAENSDLVTRPMHDPVTDLTTDPHQGVEVCTNCGLVIGQYISEESEWRTFSDRRGDDPVCK